MRGFKLDLMGSDNFSTAVFFIRSIEILPRTDYLANDNCFLNNGLLHSCLLLWCFSMRVYRVDWQSNC